MPHQPPHASKADLLEYEDTFIDFFSAKIMAQNVEESMESWKAFSIQVIEKIIVYCKLFIIKDHWQAYKMGTREANQSIPSYI